MKLALLRHGPTEWNALGRIQGRTDIPLSEAGKAEIARLSLPGGFADARAFSSPLLRARQTAELLGLKNIRDDERLIEHHWGRWEGLTLSQIREQDGEEAFARAGNAFEFWPPEGETTRAFHARVTDFLKFVAQEKRDAIAITHRGVMRSAYSLATGWAMTEAMPAALDVSCALILELDEQGNAAIAALNVPLMPRTA